MDTIPKLLNEYGGVIERFGLPIVLLCLFIFGLYRGWWIMRLHFNQNIERIKEMTVELREARLSGQQAMKIAEQSHELTKRTVDLQDKATKDILHQHERTQMLLQQILIDLARRGEK